VCVVWCICSSLSLSLCVSHTLTLALSLSHSLGVLCITCFLFLRTCIHTGKMSLTIQDEMKVATSLDVYDSDSIDDLLQKYVVTYMSTNIHIHVRTLIFEYVQVLPSHQTKPPCRCHPQTQRKKHEQNAKFVCTSMHIFINTYTYTHMCKTLLVYILKHNIHHIYTHYNKYAPIHTHTHTHAITHIHTHTLTYIYSYSLYIHIPSHTHYTNTKDVNHGAVLMYESPPFDVLMKYQKDTITLQVRDYYTVRHVIEIYAKETKDVVPQVCICVFRMCMCICVCVYVCVCVCVCVKIWVLYVYSVILLVPTTHTPH